MFNFHVRRVAVGTSPTAPEIGFRLGAYDPRYPLTIDPNYQWHTFYGPSVDDYSNGIALDASGNVYVTGPSNAICRG